jgi:tRNA pseudouridine13 synthase
MYELKQTPQDFYVREIPKYTLESAGPFTVYELRKTGISTIKALKYIAEYFTIDESKIGYAGLKDAKAVTTQYITIPHIDTPYLEQESFTLTKKGYCHRPFVLGDLAGNAFEITIRNTQNYTVHTPTKVLNYFGEQRFSTHNCEIAKLILKKSYIAAVKLIDENARDDWVYASYRAYRRKKPQDAVGALQQLDKQLLTLYIHAYQSYLWNRVVSTYIQQYGEWKDTVLDVWYTTKIPAHTIQIPLIGFDYQPSQTTPEIAQIYDTLLQEEQISPRDFISRQLPHSTKEGTTRPLVVDITQLSVTQTQDTVRCSFCLPKGSYATVAVAQLLIEKKE